MEKQTMNGQFYQRNTSKESAINTSLIITEILILVLFGFLAAFLRARLRIPLHIPGHHGVEVMFLIVLARLISRLPISSTITTMGAAGCMLIPGLGYTDPFLPVIFICFGLFLDWAFRIFPKLQLNILFILIISGIAYSFIPLSRLLLVAFTNFPYNSILKGGFTLNLLSHFCFGAIGGFMAISSYIFSNKLKSTNSRTQAN
jgi:hypothetical protein